jgi:Fur family ferric uptake transcriptional regulator
VDEQVRGRLARHGARYTPHRTAVVAALSRADGPRSASELSDDLGDDIPISSLYRSLAVLEGAGVITPHLGARDLTRYELAEWISGHHHHLVCIDCGAVEDVALPESVEDQVRGMVSDVGSASSFTPLGHTLEIEGRCAGCA